MIFPRKDKHKFESIGAIKSVEEIEQGVYLKFENAKGKIFIYSPAVLRFIITFNNEFGLNHSYAIIKPLKEWNKCEYERINYSYARTY